MIKKQNLYSPEFKEKGYWLTWEMRKALLIGQLNVDQDFLSNDLNIC